MYKSHKQYKWGGVGLGKPGIGEGYQYVKRRREAKVLEEGSEELRKIPPKGTPVILRKASDKRIREEKKKPPKNLEIYRKIGNFGELLIEALKKFEFSGRKGPNQKNS